MLKNITSVAVEIEGKMYQLLCDQDSPVQHVKAAALHFAECMDEIVNKAAKNAQATEVVEDVVEVAKIVEPLVG
jgi:cell division protein ZapA (FtsZ GTPase activity inhibitor)